MPETNMKPKKSDILSSEWLCCARTVLFFVIFALFLFQDKLQEEIALFQYFDEGIALLALPLFFAHFLRGSRVMRSSGETIALFVCLAVFWCCGWAGHFIYRYQPLTEAAKDAYVNVKFFLAAAAGYLLFADGGRTRRGEKHKVNGTGAYDFSVLRRYLWPVLYYGTAVLAVLTVLDAVFHIFSNDTRGGIPAVKLFYSAQTTLVGICVFLASMLLWFYKEKGKKIVLPLVLLSCIMFSTLRVKAVGAIACIVLVYLFVLRRQKLGRKMKIFLGFVLAFAGVAGVYQVFRYYYQMGVESARAMLTLASPYVAWDHFPTGSGFATFGSAFSAENSYSPVYGIYRMAGIWGLSPGYHQFVSDTYWPMILGQCGFFGFAALVAALVLFARKLWGMKTDPTSLASAALPFLYLLISSTSESAFANPLAVPLAFWTGILLAAHQSSGKSGTDK